MVEKIEDLEQKLESLETSSEGEKAEMKAENIESLAEKLISAEGTIMNQAKKIETLEEKIESLETSAERRIMGQGEKIETLESNLESQKTSAMVQAEKIETIKEKLETLETNAERNEIGLSEKIESLGDKLESQETFANGQAEKNKMLEEKLASLKTTEGVKSAFTVTKPVEGSNKYTARFTKAITNVGGHYSTSTGIFTCKYPGIYVFALHILRESGNSLSYASCSIRKNRSQVAEAFSNPEGNSEIGWDSSSTSVVVHLARGDEVDVYCGSSFISINARHTSFSGFLNQAD